MKVKLFVGNFNSFCTEVQLAAWFQSQGFHPTWTTIIRDRMTNHSRQFGFVEVETEVDPSKVIADLNGQRFNGRILTVTLATPRTPVAPRLPSRSPSKSDTSSNTECQGPSPGEPPLPKVNTPSIVVVSSDKSCRAQTVKLLGSLGYPVKGVERLADLQARLHSGQATALVVIELLSAAGDIEPLLFDFLRDLRKAKPLIRVVFLSDAADPKTIVKAMRLGAQNYLVRPIPDEELFLAIRNALEQASGEEVCEPPQKHFAIDFIPMGRVQDIARQVSDADVPVLICGESGVGKEVLARYIHRSSFRAREPFVKINCAALPHDLLETELFGCERGAFTGAVEDKPGKFELAGKGTILLDEIGTISPPLQGKLLHILQDNEYCRLGAKQQSVVHARVLAITNKRLEDCVARDEFREDLYFRLNVVQIQVPPLRERRQDIPLLCAHFLSKYVEKYKSKVTEIPPVLMNVFMSYEWPGNIRQLENIVRRYLILQDVPGILASLVERSENPSRRVEETAVQGRKDKKTKRQPQPRRGRKKKSAAE